VVVVGLVLLVVAVLSWLSGPLNGDTNRAFFGKAAARRGGWGDRKGDRGPAEILPALALGSVGFLCLYVAGLKALL
jgi:hypothetical protein